LPSQFRYNFSPTAGSTLGVRHSEKTRTKISQSLVGNKNALGNNPSNRKGVVVCNKNGEVINEFSSQTSAAKWLGVNQQAVSKALKRGSIVRRMYRVFLP